MFRFAVHHNLSVIKKAHAGATVKKASRAAALLLCCALLCACGSNLVSPYTDHEYMKAFTFLSGQSTDSGQAEGFAADLCVTEGNVIPPGISIEAGTTALIADTANLEFLYAKSVHEQMYPASLTKLMTALVALKNSSLDTKLTASADVTNLEAGAQTCGIAEGDTMTLDQALHLLLINSANDAAVMIAENVGGSVSEFVDEMNKEAQMIGATNTHFMNPSGLHDGNHYTTAYDMYLIFNEALNYPVIQEIINMPSYSTVYRDAQGAEKNVSVNSTNLYLRSIVDAPTGMTVIGGKTGTTSAAGHCLTILAKDTSGNPYICVVLGAPDQQVLYGYMNDLQDLAAEPK